MVLQHSHLICWKLCFKTSAFMIPVSWWFFHNSMLSLSACHPYLLSSRFLPLQFLPPSACSNSIVFSTQSLETLWNYKSGHVLLCLTQRWRPISNGMKIAPIRYILTLNPMNMNLFEKGCLQRSWAVKHLQMRSSWMTQVGPKSNDKCPSKRRKDADRREDRINIEAETGVIWDFNL